jgi:hypothetical protein
MKLHIDHGRFVPSRVISASVADSSAFLATPSLLPSQTQQPWSGVPHSLFVTAQSTPALV